MAIYKSLTRIFMGVFALIKEDFSFAYSNDPASQSRIELIYSYPGVWALFWHRISHPLFKRGFKRSARFLMSLAHFMTHIDIHPGATIGRRVFIDHGTGVVIGETAVIGDDVLIYQGVTLGGVSLKVGKRHPTIEQGVVLGAGSKVLGNITIGEYSKIGANSVVIKKVPPHSTAVGIPARVVDKGECVNPMTHNKLPDLNKEMFEYLLKRVAVLEHVLMKENKEIIEQDSELEHVYERFIKSMNS
jgi:serine O-acetyltransferase